MSTQELSVLTPEQFRFKLACLSDPSVKSEMIRHSLIEEAVDFVSELPKFYSDELERMSLWDRIGNGLLAAASKSDGNCELFINSVLTYIKASPTSVAASERLAAFITNFEKRDTTWKRDFIHQFQEYHYLIIVKARSAWQAKKEQVRHA
jgi:hypothetical protein